MKLGLMLLSLILVSCAPVAIRKPSSHIQMNYGEISFSKSYFQIFPSTMEDGKLKHYFYLQLRDEAGRYVDCESSDIVLKNNKHEKVEFSFERLMPGRYYILMKDGHKNDLSFFIRGKKLLGQQHLIYDRPDRNHSSISLIEEKDREIKLRLKLSDKNNRPIKTTNPPEIILEGLGEISALKPIQEGIWEFTVTYPEVNQLLYLSVRAQDAYFSNIYRFQHIEK